MNTPAIAIDPAITVGAREFVRFIEGHTYEDSHGATIYSGAAEPSREDAEDCIANPRTLPVTPAPREVSKLTTTRRLRELGKEDAFWALLESSPVLYREFVLAQSVRTDDPMFTTHADKLKAALALTDVQFTALLAP
jgi:hypothetical protein